MKKIKYLSLILCLMLLPMLSVKAEEVEKEKYFNIVAGDNLNESKIVDGSSIVAGNNVTAENTVDGIDMVFGANVTYNGNSDYSVVAGSIVNMSGTTKNEGFIFGETITFDKEYKGLRDLFVFGNSVTLRGEISRDVTIYASMVILEDVTINGNINVYAASLDVKDANILGKLSYNEDAEATISESAIINAQEKIKDMVIEQDTTNIILDSIIDFVSTLVVFAVLALIMPTVFNKIEKKTENMTIAKFLTMLGYGLFYLILVPIVSIILLTMVVTIPLSLLLLVVYIIVICLSTILAGYVIGLMIWKKFIKKDVNVLLAGLIGISIVKVLTLIPFTSVLMLFVCILLSLSLFVSLFTKDA